MDVMASYKPVPPKVTHQGVMTRFGLTWREAQLFMLIWEAGIDGTSDFPVESPRQYIWNIRRKLAGLGITIKTIGRTGGYTFIPESRRIIEKHFNYR
jgi:hypothetical protein